MSFLLCNWGLIAVPYNNYSFDFWGRVTPAPNAYLPAASYDGLEIGVGRFNNLMDVFTHQDGTIYLLDSGNQRIVIVDENFSLVREISNFRYLGVQDTFDSPEGLFVTPAGEIYVADTGNSRVVVFNHDGTLLRVLGRPTVTDFGSYPEEYSYLPSSIAVSNTGVIYVVAKGVYDGIIKMSLDGRFNGFFGAPKVKINPIELFWRKIFTNEQLNRMKLVLPTEYSRIHTDHRGFLYATVAKRGFALGDIVSENGKENDTSMTDTIRMLNPSGKDVLKRSWHFSPIGNIDESDSDNMSRMVDIVALPYGCYAVLDQNNGKIFVYDENGYLLFNFGNLGGSVLGTFSTPVTCSWINNKLLVVDSKTSKVTVFKPTHYAMTIFDAIAAYRSGNYETANILWNQIITLNPTFDQAYTSLGRSYTRIGDYKKAISYFTLAQNREGYSIAYKRFRNEQFRKNLPIVLSSIFIILFISILLFIIMRKKEWSTALYHSVTNGVHSVREKHELINSVFYSFFIIRHPSVGFTALKYQKRVSITGAALLLFFECISYVFLRQYTGFVYNSLNVASISLIKEFVAFLAPILMLILVNWALTTLMDGKGSFQEIFKMCVVSLLPIFLLFIPAAILSHVMTLEEHAFYQAILIFAYLWVGVLYVFGMIIIHEYSIKKVIITTILTIIGIFVLILLLMICFNILSMLIDFIKNVAVEVRYRL